MKKNLLQEILKERRNEIFVNIILQILLYFAFLFVYINYGLSNDFIYGVVNALSSMLLGIAIVVVFNYIREYQIIKHIKANFFLLILTIVLVTVFTILSSVFHELYVLEVLTGNIYKHFTYTAAILNIILLVLMIIDPVGKSRIKRKINKMSAKEL